MRFASPDTEPSTLPPLSAAMSTITLPLRIVASCASEISRGAGRPGISAVVMTMSCLAMCDETSSACAALYSSDISEARSEEHTSELQSLMRISYAVFCLKKKKQQTHDQTPYLT